MPLTLFIVTRVVRMILPFRIVGVRVGETSVPNGFDNSSKSNSSSLTIVGGKIISRPSHAHQFCTMTYPRRCYCHFLAFYLYPNKKWKPKISRSTKKEKENKVS